MDEKTLARVKRASEVGIAAGTGLLLDHKVRFGRWRDEKLMCHGTIGSIVLGTSLIVRLGCSIYESFHRENQI